MKVPFSVELQLNNQLLLDPTSIGTGIMDGHAEWWALGAQAQSLSCLMALEIFFLRFFLSAHGCPCSLFAPPPLEMCTRKSSSQPPFEFAEAAT